MPTYEYRCAACEHEFEEFQSITARVRRKCPRCGKLALRLKKEGRKPMLVAADIYRPAAIDAITRGNSPLLTRLVRITASFQTSVFPVLPFASPSSLNRLSVKITAYSLPFVKLCIM